MAKTIVPAKVRSARRTVSYYGRNCIYCGEIAEALDHIPPVSSYSFRRTAHILYRTNFRAVPTCDHCNAMLSNIGIYTINGRANYLLGKFSGRYSKLFEQGIFNEFELREMGRCLRDKAIASMGKHATIIDRMRHMKIIAAMADFYPIHYWDTVHTEGNWPIPPCTEARNEFVRVRERVKHVR
jgi:hypothetical protein